jgi:hypothetical protein
MIIMIHFLLLIGICHPLAVIYFLHQRESYGALHLFRTANRETTWALAASSPHTLVHWESVLYTRNTTKMTWLENCILIKSDVAGAVMQMRSWWWVDSVGGRFACVSRATIPVTLRHPSFVFAKWWVDHSLRPSRFQQYIALCALTL